LWSLKRPKPTRPPLQRQAALAALARSARYPLDWRPLPRELAVPRHYPRHFMPIAVARRRASASAECAAYP
jgi:hypothetical protein